MGVDVSIEHDGPVRVGERVEAMVVVASDVERDVEAIALELVGTAHIWGDQRVGAAVPFLREAKRLAGETRLTRGERRFRATFRLPADVPPSAGVADLTITYELHARVEIAWRFDPRATRAVKVLPPPPEPRGEPRRVTVAGAMKAGEPFLELTLDDDRWAPGETITGAFSIGNVDARRLDGATVAVMQLDDAMALGISGGSSVFKSLVGRGEGSVIHFALPLPKDTLPSFDSRVGKVRRAVVLRVDGSSAECVIPIVIDAFEPRAGAMRDDGEAIGGARWRRAWREEGERLSLSLARGELELSGELAAGRVAVAVAPHGNGLGAKLRWESLGIGLVVRPWSFANLGGVDLDDVSRRFADRFDAAGREEAQVRAILERELCRRLATFDRVRLDDEGAALERDVPARDQAALQRFLQDVDAVADAVVLAAARIPPPAWVDAESAAAWRAFAEATAGKLRPGSMRVRGAVVDGDRVHVETVLDAKGQPEATRVVLALDPEVDLRERVEAPAALRCAVAVLTTIDEPRSFDVQPDAVTLELPGFVRDPAVLRPIVAEMQRLSARLRGETRRGPYR